ncbi:MAG: 1-acyl-sn-glycerol-3-phosphate acyltransferase [Candidatus Omnitrophica bacterium]|nr:1-acyl-sn-glycerol-3-phosphate acyltransferase [Candidatus Omnitrophota bacterium]
MKFVISVTIWLIGGILTIALFFVVLLVTVILLPFDKKRKFSHAQCFWWANIIIFINPYWKLKIRGLDNIDSRKAYVIVANHQSLADIIILYKTHMQFKWVAKESLFKVPFIGWNLSLIKHIKLLRGNFGSIKKVYRDAIQWLRRDVSVLFFPEGTRSDSDELNKFQNGAFKIAIKEKKPILPIQIVGTREVIAKGSWFFNPNVSGGLTVLPPIDTTGLKISDFARLRDTVYGKFKAVQS